MMKSIKIISSLIKILHTIWLKIWSMLHKLYHLGTNFWLIFQYYIKQVFCQLYQKFESLLKRWCNQDKLLRHFEPWGIVVLKVFLYQSFWNKVHNLCHWVKFLLKLTLAKILSHCFQRYFGHKIWTISLKDIFGTNFEAYFSKIILAQILSYCRTIYHISPWLLSRVNWMSTYLLIDLL